MKRFSIVVLMLTLLVLAAEGRQHASVVVDSLSRTPLPYASVFGRDGKVAGTTGPDGRLPYVRTSDYPITVRYMGFKEKCVGRADADTIFLQENVMELPEFVFESRRQKVLHMLAYVREYSTLTSYTDTVFMFREKMVDYMVPSEKKASFAGWSTPRILTSRSYYRFTDAQGLDSVSDKCNNHFSWADWVGLMPAARMPARLQAALHAADTVRGRYMPAEIWTRNGDRVTLDVDVMSDTAGRKWVPNLSTFFHKDVDFEQFRIHFNYDNVAGDSLAPVDLAGYSFNIESNGRGRGMFQFNRVDDPFCVSTYAEVYVIDKEYITLKEARKWERRRDLGEIVIFEPPEAPPLQQPIQLLVDRVNEVDHEEVRLALSPDERLAGRNVVPQHFGQRVLQLFKTVTGISQIRSQRKWNKQWREFRRERISANEAARRGE